MITDVFDIESEYYKEMMNIIIYSKLNNKCAKYFWLKNKLACACHYFGDIEPKHIMSDEARKKISNANKGCIGTWKGKHLSDETRKKMSDARKGRLGTWKGKHLSDETKKKISEKIKQHNQDPKVRENKSILYKGKTWCIIDGKRVWRER